MMSSSAIHSSVECACRMSPAILYGPGDIRQAHSTDEWIAVDDIIQAARVVTAAAARYLAA